MLELFVLAFPGPDHLHPQIHFTRSIIADRGGWHDVAGAITHRGEHHIWQGTGWNHAVSADLVRWSVAPHGPKAVHETYAGMDSFDVPCSGFVTKDPMSGQVCAGFRQCGSRRGVNKTGLHNWDVPLELRCATDDALNVWDDQHPEYLFNVSFYRPVPYDPARPWRESDGYYYVLLSFDHCNTTTKALPCESGGMLVMWRSPALRGPTADWQYVGPVFSSNRTVLSGAHLTKEFVTIDFLGRLQGDPSTSPLGTRLFLNNVGGNGGGVGCCDGTTAYFVVEQSGPGQPLVETSPQGMVDWGAMRLVRLPATLGTATGKWHRSGMTLVGTNDLPSPPGIALLDGGGSRGLSMARTLGSDNPDQVTQPGRRVLIGWTGPGPRTLPDFQGHGSAQSLPRDIWLGSDRSLRQAFVPELRSLRGSEVRADGRDAWFPVYVGLQAECRATLPASCAAAGAECGISVASDGVKGARIVLSAALGLVLVDATALGNPAIRGGPLPLPRVDGWEVHVIIDHAILEVIVSNVTAFIIYCEPSEEAGRIALIGQPLDPTGATLRAWPLRSPGHITE